MHYLEAMRRIRADLVKAYGHFRIARHHPDDLWTLKYPPTISHGRELCDGGVIELVPWKYTTTEDHDPNIEYNHREILPGEIVWETDHEDKLENLKNAITVYERLREDGVEASMWPTTGKSVHVHAFFGDMPAENCFLYKKALLEHYGRGIEFDDQLMHKHLIRSEYGTHETSKGKKYCLLGTVRPTFNKLPSHIQGMVEELIFINDFHRMRTPVITRSDTLPPCVRAFSSEEFYRRGDGQKRALFVMAATLGEYYDVDTALTMLKEWNSGLKNKSTDYNLKTKLKGTINRGRKMSCQYRHDLLKKLGVKYECSSFITTDGRNKIVGEPQCVLEEKPEVLKT